MRLVPALTFLSCISCLFQLDTLEQGELASRLTMNCVNSHVDTFKLKNVPVSFTTASEFRRGGCQYGNTVCDLDLE